jgi:CDP-diacylglycerol---serine O-phosphatidyltransferase
MDKLKYLIPNSFTAFSMLLGLASIVQSVNGHYELAAWMILWGVLLDKLDGTAARLLNASSHFGAQLDSFADFISFGIAPAALLFFGLSEIDMVHYGWMMAASGIYVVAVAARLARFNVSEPPQGNLMFYGVPTTLMGALLSSGYLGWLKFGLIDEYMAPMPFLLFIASFALVSNVRLPKLKFRKNMFLNAFQALNVMVAFVLAPLQMFPEILFCQAVFYVLVGIVWYGIYPPMNDTEVDNQNEAEALV